MKRDILSTLSEQIIIGDGAMGTYLYSKGIPLSKSYDELNLTHPYLIKSIHLDYINAGARLIETNTFSANQVRLKRFGLEKKTKEINYQGAKLARESAGESIFVAGAVGPLTDVGKVDLLSSREKFDIFYQQVEALAEGGCDLIMLETFSDIDELLIALDASKKSADLPVCCQMSFTRHLKTYKGVDVVEAVFTLQEKNTDIIGINCGEGPHYNLKVLEKLCKCTHKMVSVFSNAGLPEFVDGRYIYLTTPQYFAQITYKMLEAGANIIGGCCGTGPEHIKEVARVLEAKKPLPKKVTISRIEVIEAKPAEVAPKEVRFFQKIGREIPVVVEIDSPKGLEYKKLIKKAYQLVENGVDAITVGDNPLAITRMGNIGFAHLLETEGIQTIAHIACRDRNLIALQSMILEADALGISAILAITGDPARIGDQPGASSVFDLNSVELIKLIKNINKGKNFANVSIGAKANFVIGCAFNPNAENIDYEIKRLQKKIDAGAQFALSQVLYDKSRIKLVYARLKKMCGDFPVFFGVMPLLNSRNAHFIANEVPGITMPQEILNRMDKAPFDKQTQEGINISLELVEEALKYAKGFYLVPPFQNIVPIIEIVKYIKSYGI